MVAADRAGTARAWQRLLDAEVVRDDKVPALSARRTTLAVGTSEVEVLEADGSGPVDDYVRRRGPAGLFAAGFAVSDLAALEADWAARDVDFTRADQQLLLAPEATGGTGLRVVVSQAVDRSRVGLLDRLYEVTNLVANADAPADALCRVFGLDAAPFVPINSENYGYRGLLTLFDADELDRIEIIHPYDGAKTMGRFFGKHGPCLYMCYGETDRPEQVRERALEAAPADWTGPREGRPDNQFLHPKALGGVMLGVSRTTFAWSWSGSPDRIDP